MKEQKKVRISDFLTPEETIAAIRIYGEAREGTFAKKCADEIITPVLPRINKKLGQENHALFLAYMVEYVFIQTGVKKKLKQMEKNEYGRNGTE